MDRRLLVVLVVVLSAGTLLAAGSVTAQSATDRTVSNQTPAPGDTVTVTVTTTVAEPVDIDYADEFDPELAGSSLEEITVDGSETFPSFSLFADDIGVLSADAVGAGTIEIVYTVTIPDDAADGDTFTLDPSFEIDGDEQGLDPTTLTVGGAAGTLAIETFEPPDSVTVGETITAAYTLRNTGAEPTTELVQETVDGTVIADDEHTVEPGETVTGTITYPTAADDTPSVDVGLTTAEASTTATVGVASPSEPGFSVSLTETPTGVTAGETVTVPYTVTNTGGAAGTQEVTLTIDDTTVASQSHSLEAGGTVTDEFTYTTGDDDPPAVTATVASADDSVTTAVDVAAVTAATFDVSIDAPLGRVGAGETLTVPYTVANTGDDTATQDVVLTIDGDVFARASHSLDPGATASGEFTYTTVAADRPEVTVGVETVGASATTPVSVTEPDADTPVFAVTLDELAETATAGASLTVPYTVTNTGATAGTHNVTLTVNGTAVESQPHTLAPNDSVTDAFTYDLTAADTPAVTVGIESIDTVETGSVSVTPADGDDADEGDADAGAGDDGAGAPSGDDASDAVPGFGIGITLVAVVVSVGVCVRRVRRE